MSTIHFKQTTTATPEQFVAGLTSDTSIGVPGWSVKAVGNKHSIS